LTDALHRLVEHIANNHFHNHRGQDHSTLLCQYILDDLAETCESFRSDLLLGIVKNFGGAKTPGARGRKADMLVARPLPIGKKLLKRKKQERPDFSKLRIFGENKSVITAHRNAMARFDDLTEVLGVLYSKQPDAIFVATALIGTSPRYLNVNDGVKKHYKFGRMAEFESKILPRLSTGDQALWEEFPEDISPNKPGDPAKSVEAFRKLPIRGKAQTHLEGYDFVLLVPVEIDNVNPPRLAPAGTLGIDAISDYNAMIRQLCETYTVRFH
jgi:hypothetical protein